MVCDADTRFKLLCVCLLLSCIRAQARARTAGHIRRQPRSLHEDDLKTEVLQSHKVLSDNSDKPCLARLNKGTNGRICLDEPEKRLDDLSTRDSTFECHYYQMMSILRIARPAAARRRSSLRTAVVIISEPTTVHRSDSETCTPSNL